MADLEYRYREARLSAAPSAVMQVEGDVLAFGVPEDVAGMWRETWKPGSLRRADGGVKLNWQHKRDMLLAREAAGLTLFVGDDKMRMEARMANTSISRDVYELVKSGVASGLSAGFWVIRETWPTPTDRIIEEAVLDHVAIVDDPEYEATTIAARARHGMQMRSHRTAEAERAEHVVGRYVRSPKLWL